MGGIALSVEHYEHNKPSSRLLACADFVRRGSRVADIGADHGLLTIYLVRSGISPGAIAADVNAEPLSTAIRNIGARGLSDRIQTVLSDGLAEIVPDTVDDIVIAGMGGDLIARILSRCEWIYDKRLRLVLQPMSKADRLRTWLYANGFSIIEEKVVADSGRYYTVMCCEYTEQADGLQDDMCAVYFGSLLDCTDDAARHYLKKVEGQLNDMLSGCRAKGDSEGAAEITAALERLKNKEV